MTLTPGRGRAPRVSFALPGATLDKLDKLAAESGCRRSDILRAGVELVVDRTSLAAEVALRLAEGPAS